MQQTLNDRLCPEDKRSGELNFISDKPRPIGKNGNPSLLQTSMMELTHFEQQIQGNVCNSTSISGFDGGWSLMLKGDGYLIYINHMVVVSFTIHILP